MVLIQDVFRYLLSPVEKTFKRWEQGSGVKAKIAKTFRIGNVGPGVFESIAKILNNYNLWLFYFTQRPWGPLYKRLMEFDMHPTKLTFPFFAHMPILLIWFGSTFLEDTFQQTMIENNPDYLNYYIKKYNRNFQHNALNWRTSAHYIEINRIYTVEMSKKFQILVREIREESQRKKTLELAN